MSSEILLAVLRRAWLSCLHNFFSLHFDNRLKFQWKSQWFYLNATGDEGKLSLNLIARRECYEIEGSEKKSSSTQSLSTSISWHNFKNFFFFHALNSRPQKFHRLQLTVNVVSEEKEKSPWKHRFVECWRCYSFFYQTNRNKCSLACNFSIAHFEETTKKISYNNERI